MLRRLWWRHGEEGGRVTNTQVGSAICIRPSSTRCSDRAIESAPTHVKICPACDSAPGMQPNPPSKLRHLLGR